jgi:hypothetical protein
MKTQKKIYGIKQVQLTIQIKTKWYKAQQNSLLFSER